MASRKFIYCRLFETISEGAWLLSTSVAQQLQSSAFSPCAELPEKQEQLCAIYSVLEQLPQANHDTLERLIFHLVK